MGDVASGVAVATGLQREAACLRGIPGVAIVAGGGDEAALRARLAATEARAVVSFGMAGALVGGLAIGDWVVADRLAGTTEQRTDPGWRDRLAATLPGARIGAVFCDGRLISSASEKRAIGARHGALAIDLESAAAAAVAEARGIPLAVVRCISDAAGHDLPPAFTVAMGSGGGLDLAAILRSLTREPRQIGEVIAALGRGARAMRALRRGGARLAPVLRDAITP